MPNCEALHKSDFYCYSFNGVLADYASYGSPMPMRRNLVQCSLVYDTTISNIYALNDTFNGAGNTGSFVGAIGTTVTNPSGNELEVSSTTVYPVISSTISTTTGKEYTVSADLNGMSFSPGYTASVMCEVIEGGITVASQTSSAPGNFNFTYTAGAGSASVRYTFVLTPNPGPPPPPPMAPFSFTLDNALVYFIDTSISSETICVSKNGYRYGFNGMEKVDEILGEENYYTAEFWEYESRLSLRFNIDPVLKEFESPYSCFNGNPILKSDPHGDDATTGNPKGDRSIAKYKRKFQKYKRKYPNLTNSEIHKKLEEKYNNRRWMWVKGENTTHNNQLDAGHVQYFHAGDLYREMYEKTQSMMQSTQTINLISSSNGVILDKDGDNSTYYYVYPINTDGAVNINISPAIGTNTWTYYLSQGSNEKPQEIPSTNLDGPVDVNSTNSGSLSGNVNISNGQYLYVLIEIPINSKGGKTMINEPSAVTMTINVTVIVQNSPKAKPITLVRTKKNPNPDKLNKKTREELKQKRRR